MPDFTKSIIYRIVCKDLNITDCYVGSTTNFKGRKREHKSTCNNPNDKRYNYKLYKFMRENGGWENWDMIMIEKYPCNDKLELLKKEREVFETLNASLNSEIPSRTQKQHYEDNKERIKQYRLDNKETINKKIGCRACKCMVIKRRFIIHTKTKKHIKNINAADQKY